MTAVVETRLYKGCITFYCSQAGQDLTVKKTTMPVPPVPAILCRPARTSRLAMPAVWGTAVASVLQATPLHRVSVSGWVHRHVCVWVFLFDCR